MIDNKQREAEKYIYEGNDYLAEGKIKEAVECFNKSLKAKKDYHIAYYNLGNIYLHFRDFTKAKKYYQKALKIKPNYTKAKCSLGMAYSEEGKFEQALTCLQEAIEINKDYGPTYIYLGNILLAQGNIQDAILCYNMAVKKDPSQSNSYVNLGTAYARQLEFKKAIKQYKKAIELDPNNTSALINLANAYGKGKNIKKSIKYSKRAYELDPKNSHIIANLCYQLSYACNWDELKKYQTQLRKLSNEEMLRKIRPGEEPFSNVISNENQKRNLEIARAWSNNIKERIVNQKGFKFPKDKNKKRIHIGYFSGHFRNHPTSYLITKLFEKHDRRKFKLFIYSHTPPNNSKYYKRVIQAADIFRDISNDNLSDMAKRIYDDKIDILIDLDGYTDNNQLEVLALRPAPIIATYLGFPGTTGADFIDYIITDKVVTPPQSSKYYAEKFAYLPHSYQVNNNETKTYFDKEEEIKRSDFGLPSKGFVFCSFNNTYKITRKMFDAWLRILKAVPNSVLWLYQSNSLASKNLIKYAQEKGVSPKRIIFAKDINHQKHMRRISLADLALDTIVCNGHTTTSESLWAGVPILTMKGKHFASRVAASLLKSAGIPDLITKNLEDYEKKAIKFGKNPKLLDKYKKKLTKLSSKPPFNTEKFTKNLEKIYERMVEIYQSKGKPQQIEI